MLFLILWLDETEEVEEVAVNHDLLQLDKKYRSKDKGGKRKGDQIISVKTSSNNNQKVEAKGVLRIKKIESLKLNKLYKKVIIKAKLLREVKGLKGKMVIKVIMLRINSKNLKEITINQREKIRIKA